MIVCSHALVCCFGFFGTLCSYISFLLFSSKDQKINQFDWKATYLLIHIHVYFLPCFTIWTLSQGKVPYSGKISLGSYFRGNSLRFGKKNKVICPIFNASWKLHVSINTCTCKSVYSICIDKRVEGILSFIYLIVIETKTVSLLCRLRSIAVHRDHFVRRLSVR